MLLASTGAAIRGLAAELARQASLGASPGPARDPVVDAGLDALGVTLDGSVQSDLLVLAAYRNRLFRYPPPVRIIPADIRAAYGALDRLVERLQGV